MSANPAAVYQTDENTQRRTFLVGIRLFLAANTMMMGALLFAYLYLRATNNNGMWRPDGIADLSSVPMGIILLLQLACLLVVLGALAAARRGAGARAMGVVALLLALAAGGMRVWYQYNLGDHPTDPPGWVINNGTYAAVTEMWFGILIIEILVGVLWLFTIVLPGPRSAHPLVAARHLRGFAEFWGYMLVASTFVFLLARLV
jgi:heme/copper-type cytochrome/quinol oxidase subunit 3